MKVLVTSNSKAKNTYINSLLSSLKAATIQVECSIEKFWNSDQDYDIIYLQWPEELFKWKEINRSNISDLKKRLNYWSKNSKIIIVRHNLLPHRNQNIDVNLYHTVYEHVNGVIHMAKFSKTEFKKRYPTIQCIHSVIPHPKYMVESFNSIPQSRKILKLNTKLTVFLVPGLIRDYKEQKMLIEAFKNMTLPSKLLIIIRGKYKYQKPIGKTSPIKRIIWEFQFFLYRIYLLKYKIKIGRKFLSDSILNNYLSASDIIVIPRIKSLNSGILPLGFTFGKVVIGTNFGNIGEILSETNNPVFEPQSTISILSAMEKAFILSKGNQGLVNQKYAESNWNIHTIGKLHYKFFNTFLK